MQSEQIKVLVMMMRNLQLMITLHHQVSRRAHTCMYPHATYSVAAKQCRYKRKEPIVWTCKTINVDTFSLNIWLSPYSSLDVLPHDVKEDDPIVRS